MTTVNVPKKDPTDLHQTQSAFNKRMYNCLYNNSGCYSSNSIRSYKRFKFLDNVRSLKIKVSCTFWV